MGSPNFTNMRKNFLFLLAAVLCWNSSSIANSFYNPPKRNVKTAQTPATNYLNFLYKYMALPDKTDYSKAFYEENVALSLRARREMPWGKTVPEREFKHFVLPVRVNNENLDDSRKVFYAELKNRVKNLSMQDAILEVNHWCHEKVTYRPTDGRTSSPLASVCTAYGRCGEESTFLVAALRTVGIPARQVYTPRWAHTDDNHAWVEAWADGKWFFLGACEPEPILNLGWFNESASRGMLMHTKVFGDYDGPEEVMSKTPLYTEINVISNYAPTAEVKVVVVDEKGRRVKGAKVEFKLYNYAEFYSVARKTTDDNGVATLTAGKGDMIVWASKDGKVGIDKVSFGKTKELRLVLKRDGLPQTKTWDITPPPVSTVLPNVTAAQRAENTRRLAHEDSIRQAYEATMKDRSRGNYATIQTFLREAKNKEMAKRLLDVISEKDLRDVQLTVLKDHEVAKTDTSELYCKYVMNPRVEIEWLSPYRHFLAKKMAGIRSPQALIAWCKSNIAIDETHNPQRLRMLPMSVWRERKTDKLGRAIFFVAAARSLGFPARINEINGKLQYNANGAWIDVEFDGKQAEKSVPKGTLLLEYKPTKYNDNPKYYSHFTLSKIENGVAQLLTYPETATWKDDFSKGTDLEEGTYMLITGTRMASGQVLAETYLFTIKAGKETRLTFTMREDDNAVQVIGSFNAEDIYHDRATNSDKSLLSTAGRGYYMVGIVAPNQEPTNHTLRDISTYKAEFEKWGRKMIFLFEDADNLSRFNFKEFDNLPSNVVWGTDVDKKIVNEIREQLKLKSPSLPIFLICDSFNRVVYVQQGYTINIGEQILKVIGKL